VLLIISIRFIAYSQIGSIKGVVTEEVDGKIVPMAFANVYLEGTTNGTTTDFDGKFMLNAQVGNYNLMCTFMGYLSIKKPIEVTENGMLTVTIEMKTEGIALEGVKVVAKMNRESEVALIMEQKEAMIIKESIGAKQLSNMGVSDAAAATTKISGVAKSEGSNDIYIRGLGDRYLLTTMNGLPIPSDDVDKKNIDLNLFSTDVIENVGISKTYSVSTYADQTSGSVDISSKTTADELSVELSTVTNTNIVNGSFSSFKTTQNKSNTVFGFYTPSADTKIAVKEESWNTLERKYPVNYGFSFLTGKKVQLFSKELDVFATVSHSGSSSYSTGVYKKYRSNVLDRDFSDAESFETDINTTGLLNLSYKLNINNSLNYSSLWVLKTKDQLYEQGRNGRGYVFDQYPSEDSAFVRDQNIKETHLIINQIMGTHLLGAKNTLNWGAAYNYVNADEPNRIRNEVNYINGGVQFADVGDMQQRRSEQNIRDNETSAYLKHELKFVDEEKKSVKLNVGGNFRNKQREFNSLFVGVRARGVSVASIDNLDEAFMDESLYESGTLIVRDNRKPDLYNANLGVYGGFASIDMVFSSLSGSVGVRYEVDKLNVIWDVTNWPGRVSDVSYSYENVLPGISLKYAVSDKSAFRLASSKTITLPEFKELAPFEYNSPEGRVTVGNPDLINSENYNFDAKWELFPTSKELVSMAGFYKIINNPINLTQARGSSGNFKYENTGEQATVYGVEIEGKFFLLKTSSDNTPDIKLSFNATKMWFNQDLKENFQYYNKTEVGLQGASDLIINGSVTFLTHVTNPFMATLTGNYSSDKIYALGAPEDKESSARLFNSEIIEKGFVSLDMVLSKQINNKISAKLYAKNLLNPTIEQTQEIVPLTDTPVFTDVVKSYRKGVQLGFSVNINLN
jgi:outer membrane receptor protein involved in Fe transport